MLDKSCSSVVLRLGFAGTPLKPRPRRLLSQPLVVEIPGRARRGRKAIVASLVTLFEALVPATARVGSLMLRQSRRPLFLMAALLRSLQFGLELLPGLPLVLRLSFGAATTNQFERRRRTQGFRVRINWPSASRALVEALLISWSKRLPVEQAMGLGQVLRPAQPRGARQVGADRGRPPNVR